MSVPNTVGLKRRPTHPGEMLREDFLPDYGLSVSGMADRLGVSRQSVNELLRERRARESGNGTSIGSFLWQLARILAQCTTGSRPLGRSPIYQERRSSNKAARRRLNLHPLGSSRISGDMFDLWRIKKIESSCVSFLASEVFPL